MPDKNRVFVDLDECLVYEMDGIHLLRPGTHLLLNGLRLLAETYILTGGAREHATTQNEAHQMGFKPEELVAQEDYYTMQFLGGWASGREPLVHAKRNLPRAILIDNQPHTFNHTRAKLEHLGITEKRLITVPHYGSGEPEDRFPNLVPAILEKVKALLAQP